MDVDGDEGDKYVVARRDELGQWVEHRDALSRIAELEADLTAAVRGYADQQQVIELQRDKIAELREQVRGLVEYW